MSKLKVCAIGLLAAVCGSAAPALAGATPLTTVRVASGLSLPIYATYAPGDYTRLFIIEKRGVIKILDLTTNTVNPTAFLNIDALIAGGTSVNDERGLLGLAFHPDYQTNGKFYVNYTNAVDDTIVAEYTVSANPDVADAGSGNPLLFIDQPFSNHNGGWIGFGPDGYLYVSTGDGGSACDPGNRAQDITNQLLGKMLRIDINGDDFPADPVKDYAIPGDNPFVGIDGDDEIWAYGLRNAWRPSFDRETGDLYIADVGQGVREEINFQPASSTGGENYAWDCEEGNVCASLSGCGAGACTCGAAGFADPFQVYTHAAGRCSITGGYVYRGCAIPGLAGTYFYADYCTAQIWSLRYDGVTISEFQERTAELDPPGTLAIANVTSFGEDAYGELYITDQSGGELYKIIPVGGPFTDCNGNTVEDSCEILSGAVSDTNNNGVPDLCEGCPGDATGNGTVDFGDLNEVLTNWGTPGPAGDIAPYLNPDGIVDFSDLNLVLEFWDTTCE